MPKIWVGFRRRATGEFEPTCMFPNEELARGAYGMNETQYIALVDFTVKGSEIIKLNRSDRKRFNG